MYSYHRLEGYKVIETQHNNIDFFISHSKELKYQIVIPFTQIMSSFGFNLWIDKKGINTGDNIYSEIKTAISNSTYCIAFIDAAFLSRDWTKKEIKLFCGREQKERREMILPVFVAVEKEEVYEMLPELNERAFESIESIPFNQFTCLEIICRIIERFFSDISSAHFNEIGNELINYSFPCKETYVALFKNREIFSTDFRIATLAICNLGSILVAIYDSLANSPDRRTQICNKFYNLFREKCFDTSFLPTYATYNAAIKTTSYVMQQLKSCFDII